MKSFFSKTPRSWNLFEWFQIQINCSRVTNALACNTRSDEFSSHFQLYIRYISLAVTVCDTEGLETVSVALWESVYDTEGLELVGVALQDYSYTVMSAVKAGEK